MEVSKEGMKKEKGMNEYVKSFNCDSNLNKNYCSATHCNENKTKKQIRVSPSCSHTNVYWYRYHGNTSYKQRLAVPKMWLGALYDKLDSLEQKMSPT